MVCRQAPSRRCSEAAVSYTRFRQPQAVGAKAAYRLSSSGLKAFSATACVALKLT
jgi:hypothetical protein